MEYLNTKLLTPKLRNDFERIIHEISAFRNQILIGICVCFIVYLIGRLIKRITSNFPPGPTGLPILGYLPFLSEDIHLDLIELGKKYGDVFSLPLGSQNFVILHGADAIKEAFAKPELLGRPPNADLEIVNRFSKFLFGIDTST
ncbi:UNVERIFIED_CONTAM: Cyp18a1 [Trichonephila clavipes]